MKLKDKINQIHQINFNNLHIYFFYIFLFSIPLQARKVFLTDFSFYSGSFTEYTTYFLYASDVFLFLAISFWLVFNIKFITYIKEVEFADSINNAIKSSKVFLFLLIFIDWLIIDTVINNKYLEISVFRIIKFVELSFLFVYICHNLKNKKELITSLFIVSVTGFLQGIIAIYQFSFQHSLFWSPLLRKITGETIIGSNFPGVAKIVFGGEKIARAYGTFPHPNILGGFLIFSIMLSIYLYLEHKNYILSRLERSYELYNIKYTKSQEYLVSFIWVIFIFVQIIGLFLTFSRIVWAGFFISIISVPFLYFVYLNIVSRETANIIKFRVNSYLIAINKLFFDFFSKKNITKYRELAIISLLTIILIITCFAIIRSRLSFNLENKNVITPSNYALSDRAFYNIVSRETINNNFLTGSGLGTFIFQIGSYLKSIKISQKLEPWQYQPAHNIYLLIASEIGLVGLALFLLFIAYLVSDSVKNLSKLLNFVSKNKSKIVSYETIDNDSIFLALINYWKKFVNLFLAIRKRITGSIVSRETIKLSLYYNKEKVQKQKIDSSIMSQKEIVLENVSRETLLTSIRKLNYFLLPILATFLFIGLFDHYFWTLQQGQLTFWLVLGMLKALNKGC